MTERKDETGGAALDAGAMIQQQIDAGEWFPAEPGRHGQFCVTPDGVFHKIAKGKQEGGIVEEETRICDYLRVIAITHDENFGGVGLYVEYQNQLRGGKQVKIIPKKITADPRQLHALLEDCALSIDIDPPRSGMSALCHYLRDFPLAGLPKVVTVTMGGWLEDEQNPFSSFVFKNECLSGKHGRRALLDEAEGEGFRLKARGSLEAWQQTIGQNAPFSRRVMFAICASLSAPLLPILGGSSVMYHFYGDSSTGKSTALHAAGSVWGTAREVRTVWDKTKNNLETKAIQFNNLPLIVDELKQLDQKTAQAIAYAFGNGVERGRNSRGGKAAITREWLTMGLSAGEVTLNEVREGKGMATGEQMRFIHIPALANDAAPGYGLFEDFPSYVKESEASQTAAAGGCSVARRGFLDSFKDETNAGAAGREWIIRLLRHFDEQPNGVRGFMQQARAELANYANDERWQGLSHTAMRVFAGFNLIALGGRLAAQLRILPWQDREIDAAVFGCFDAWLLSDQNPEANYERFSRAQASEQQTMGVFYAHYDRKGTRVLTEAERVPNDGLLGALILDAETGAAAPENAPELNSPILAFVYAPEQFRKLVSRIGGGLNVRECAKTLRESQRLYGNDKTKTPPYHPHRKSRPHFGMQGGGAYYVVIPMTDDVTKAAGRLNEALAAARQAGAN